jgi:hypothetical protein
MRLATGAAVSVGEAVGEGAWLGVDVAGGAGEAVAAAVAVAVTAGVAEAVGAGLADGVGLLEQLTSNNGTKTSATRFTDCLLELARWGRRKSAGDWPSLRLGVGAADGRSSHPRRPICRLSSAGGGEHAATYGGSASMSATCPTCGATLISIQRKCPSCGLDLVEARRASLTSGAAPPAQSFTERYRGTPWETAPAPALRARRRRRRLVLAAGLFVLLAALLLASRSQLLDIRLDLYTAAGLSLLGLVFAGWASTVVPGSRARGLFKSVLLAFISSWLAFLAAVALNAWDLVRPEYPIRLAWLADQYVIVVIAAVLFRLILLLTEI